jgi:hypothetical protein
MKSKLVSGLAIAALASTAFVGVASAQWTDTASGGNGGVSTADSSGGSVSIGSTNSGGTSGTQTAIDEAIATGDLDNLAAMIIASVLGAE